MAGTRGWSRHVSVHSDALNIGVSKLIDFNNAIGNAINTITAGTIFGGPGMAPTGNVSGAPSASWQKFTDYGPSIDPKGSKYYDSNSFNGRGAYGQLRNGDVAANPAWMWSHYHVRPGGTYTSDRDGKEHAGWNVLPWSK